MLIDELKEQLKSISPDLDAIAEFWKNTHSEDHYQSLYATINQSDFWQNPRQHELSKEFQHSKTQRDEYLHIMQSFKELNELIDLFQHDEPELLKLKPDVGKLSKAVALFKLHLLLNKEFDQANAFLSINAGAGGTESQDWAEMLLRMYIRFAERQGFNATLIDYQAGETAGIKSATLFIKGPNAYGLLKGEQGIHRLVRISPFDANKRRHTSFAAVSLSPEVPNIQITIDPKDLRIDTYRAGGAGGQHVNKTESAVRITHIPSGIVTQCQNERSQVQNKETALKMLQAKLLQRQKEEEEAKTASIEKKKIEWGSQIRSYVLHPYKLVKDHRTDEESPQPDLVLDGEIMPFIERYLIWAATSQ